MPDIVMPRLSDTMEEGELSRWLKKVGDPVAKGDVIAEIETDKATMDLEAFDEGVLEEILVAEGTVVPIGQPLARIGDGSGASSPGPAHDETAAQPAEAEPAAQPEQTDQPEQAEQTEQAEPEQAASTEEPEPEGGGTDATPAPEAPPHSDTGGAAAPGAPRPAAGELRMSPLARRIAREHGLDPATIEGSGPDGRVVRADVEDAIKGVRQPASAAAEAAPEEVPLNNIRRVTARRLTQSQAVPHFFLTSVIEADRLVALRAELNEQLADQGVKFSLNDLIVRACVVTLQSHPEVNASWGEDKILRHRRINIGFAVSLDDGLIVPVIADAGSKRLGEISAETRELAERARAGKLKPQEFSGGTFTISNLGMFGIDEFTAVINPPEAAILAVGAVTQEPALREERLVNVSRMKITLTVDHRVLDGAVAAAFMRDLKAVLEEPLRLLV